MGSKKKHKREGGESPITKEEFEQHYAGALFQAVALIEAYGSLERVALAGYFDVFDENLGEWFGDFVERLTPVDRGGQNDEADAQPMWQELMDAVMRDPDARQFFVEAQQGIATGRLSASGRLADHGLVPPSLVEKVHETDASKTVGSR